MAGFFKTFFACLLAIVSLFALIFIGLFLIGSISGSGKPSVSKNSVLTLDLSQAISEQSKDESFSFNGVEESVNGLHDVLQAIEFAKTDKKIKGIYIKLSMTSLGWSKLYDIKNALEDFKSSKKFVYAYGHYTDQKSLYLSSIADKTYINPIGAVELKGLAATGTFFKKALDKLEVEPVVFYCGKFKGASEPYRLEKYSEPNKQQIKDLLSDFYAEFLTALAKKSGKDTATIAALANGLVINRVNDAVVAKLIDGAKYEGEFLDELRTKLALKTDEKISFASMSTYKEIAKSKYDGSDKIAVLLADGEIRDGEDEDGIISDIPMIKQIRKLTNDDKIKAVVLRINSPGGSALASENMYQELKRLHAKKPIVVSMGDVAASGGYYLSCASDSIFAQPTTITGSIGVVGMMLNFESFMKNKIGITTDVVKTAEHADFPNVTRKFTTDEMAYIQRSVDSTYMVFKTRVKDARKMSMALVDSIAQGHVYSGLKAKKIGLVDEIGGLDRAIASAKSLAKLKDIKVTYYPFAKDGMQSFVEKISGKKSEDEMLKSALGEEYKYYLELKNLKINSNKILMLLPNSIDIK